MKMKTCSKCKESKPLRSFFRRKKSSLDGRMSLCKICATLKIYSWRSKNPEKWRSYVRKSYHIAKSNGTYAKRFSTHPARRSIYRMKTRYGITQDQLVSLLKKQNKSCAICRIKLRMDRKQYAIDHCHKTKIIRGILCHRCNLGIGFMRDDPSLFISACDYLSPELNETHILPARQARKLAGIG